MSFPVPSVLLLGTHCLTENLLDRVVPVCCFKSSSSHYPFYPLALPHRPTEATLVKVLCDLHDAKSVVLRLPLPCPVSSIVHSSPLPSVWHIFITCLPGHHTLLVLHWALLRLYWFLLISPISKQRGNPGLRPWTPSLTSLPLLTSFLLQLEFQSLHPSAETSKLGCLMENLQSDWSASIWLKNAQASVGRRGGGSRGTRNDKGTLVRVKVVVQVKSNIGVNSSRGDGVINKWTHLKLSQRLSQRTWWWIGWRWRGREKLL